MTSYRRLIDPDTSGEGALVLDLPAGTLKLTGREFADRDGCQGKLAPVEGQALRAVRQIIFANDPFTQSLPAPRRTAQGGGDSGAGVRGDLA